MSQIPRRTNLSMTQPPKVRKTPSSQSLAKRNTDSESPRTSLKTIDLSAPIVIEDNGFGDMMDNDDLIQVLSSVEEKNGHHKETVVVGATETVAAEKPKESPQPRRSKKEKKNSEPQSDYLGAGDETCSSVRTSVDSSVTVRSGDETPLEMGSLVIPDDDELVTSRAEKSVSSNVDSPRPNNKTPGGTKIVRLTKGMRLSPFRKANGDQQQQQQPLDNISTIVNLSTVSEQSVENHLDSPPAAVTPKNGNEDGVAAVGDQVEEDEAISTGSSRVRISARRTFSTNRPLREMSFRNATREAYRKIGEDGEEEGAPATVNDSVNATVGSELGLHLDDLPETPAGGVGQKRRRNQDEDGSDVDDDENEGAPEPKKSFLQTYCVVM